ALELLDEACTTGLQLGELVDQFIAYWRDLMVVQCAGPDGRDLSVPARHHETLKRHARAVSLDAVLAGLDVLSATRARLRGSNHGRTLVEMALVRLGRLGDLVSLSQLSQWLSQTRLNPGQAPSPVQPARLTAPPEGVKKTALTSPLPEPSDAPDGPLALTPETLPRIWAQALAMMPPMLGSQAKRCELPAIIGPNTLVLSFPGAYNREGGYCQ